ncbi:MAG TPA: hypothetical protein VMD30_02415, partial [Tepidisphaeraceae bacterium]|nr:hypothetical protein [Tepidisphaeraceae bacterium]
EPEIEEPNPREMAAASPLIDTHEMDPAKVLRLVRALGGDLRRLFLVGCEPTPFDVESDMAMSLSPAVQGAVERAVEMVEELVGRIRNSQVAAVQ